MLPQEAFQREERYRGQGKEIELVEVHKHRIAVDCQMKARAGTSRQALGVWSVEYPTGKARRASN